MLGISRKIVAVASSPKYQSIQRPVKSVTKRADLAEAKLTEVTGNQQIRHP
jgi:hypothetical protein